MAVAQGHEGGAGVGDGRQARLGEQADILAVEQGQKGFHLLRRGVLVEDMQVQSVDVAAQAVARQETARGTQLFHHEAAQAAGTLQDGLRQDFGGFVVTERGRDQV